MPDTANEQAPSPPASELVDRIDRCLMSTGWTETTTPLLFLLEEANRQHKADRDALESAHFWLGELVPLTEELNADLKRFYQPDKGWPPHIAKANDLGDYKQVLSDLRAALEQSR